VASPASAPLRSAFLPRPPLFSQRAPPLLPRRAHIGEQGRVGLGAAGKRVNGVRAEAQPEKPEGRPPFGYTRLDVILIGVGITVAGVALKYGLELAGFDSFQSGSVVQLVLVLGLCLVWAASYVWRVGNKEMTYVKQLKDYEDAVMKVRHSTAPLHAAAHSSHHPFPISHHPSHHPFPSPSPIPSPIPITHSHHPFPSPIPSPIPITHSHHPFPSPIPSPIPITHPITHSHHPFPSPIPITHPITHSHHPYPTSLIHPYQ
ncbi:unnamed protein product, partial [Closterium sp. Naga37s-1]